MERKYCRALSFREWEGKLPSQEPQVETSNPTLHEWDQCAEYISLPYVLKFAKDYLSNNEQKRKIVVYCLTMTSGTGCTFLPFCTNCQTYVRQVGKKISGLCIIDFTSNPKAVEERITGTYQSDETVSLNDIVSVL